MNKLRFEAAESNKLPNWLNSLSARLIVYLIGFFLIALLFSPITYIASDLHLIDNIKIKVLIFEIIKLLSTTIPAFLILRYLYKENPITTLGLQLKGQGKPFLMGIVITTIVFSLGFSILKMAGWVTITDISFDIISIVYSLLLYILVALSEEIFSRGFVLGQMLERGTNRYLALFISAGIFSCLHIGNKDMTILPFINIWVAGCFIGAAYIYTRNLWFSIAIHLTWNWLEGPIYGFSVSGNDKIYNCVLTIKSCNNVLLSGGKFGFEASLTCLLLTSITTAIIIYHFEKKRTKKFIQ